MLQPTKLEASEPPQMETPQPAMKEISEQPKITKHLQKTIKSQSKTKKATKQRKPKAEPHPILPENAAFPSTSDDAPIPEKPIPKQAGISAQSTVTGGQGPLMQVGNTQMGALSNIAETPVSALATPLPARAFEPANEASEAPIRKEASVSNLVKPQYTRAALRAGIEGKITLLVSIDEEGRVTQVKLLKGLGFGLDEAAIEAVRSWHYSPATVNGRAVASTKRERVSFVLER